MILSASRRTDIPAFYGKWFMQRLKEKYVLVRNPFNIHQLSNIPLTTTSIDAIVFWTKNSLPIHKYLKDIDNMGYQYYFQYTITPYKKDMEENLLDKKIIINSFQELSSLIGKEKVILRYDPIVLTSSYTIDYHIKAFEKLCNHLKDYTNKIIFSFLDDYKKISKNMKSHNVYNISQDDMQILAENFSSIAKSHNITLESCAEKIDLEKYNINHSKCIDDELIEKITGYKLKAPKDSQREHCNCIKCIDIGEYNSCIHNCLYCYANINKESASINHKLHNPNSPLLIGDINHEKDKIVNRNKNDIKSYKQEKNIEDFI